ncbi:MAG TPA: hypothetical protein PK478_02080 [Nitrospira sp.]|nr:hypothetical protein [Nitrospira sp.]
MSTAFWTAFWITVGVLFVLVDATLALNRTPGDTATERIRAGMRRWRWFRLLVVCFLAWLTIHLLFEPGYV